MIAAFMKGRDKSGSPSYDCRLFNQDAQRVAVSGLTSEISYQYQFFSRSRSFFGAGTFLKCMFTCVIALLFSMERVPLIA